MLLLLCASDATRKVMEFRRMNARPVLLRYEPYFYINPFHCCDCVISPLSFLCMTNWWCIFKNLNLAGNATIQCPTCANYQVHFVSSCSRRQCLGGTTKTRHFPFPSFSTLLSWLCDHQVLLGMVAICLCCSPACSHCQRKYFHIPWIASKSFQLLAGVFICSL